MPNTQAGFDSLRSTVLANPMYRNMMISDDALLTTLIIEVATAAPATSESSGFEDDLEGFESDMGGFEAPPPQHSGTDEQDYTRKLSSAEDEEILNTLEPITTRYSTGNFTIRTVGSPAIMHYLKKTMLSNMRRFVVISLVAIIIMLLIMFRRPSGIILPLVIIMATISSTIGSMALSGVPLQIPTQILPSFLVAVVVGAVIHALALFYRNLVHGHRKREAIVEAYTHSALPICMTSLTTAAGLMALKSAEIAPIANLGVFASLGILLGLLYTLVLLPALIALLPIKATVSAGKESRAHAMDAFLRACAHFSHRHAKVITIIGLLSLAAGFYFASQLRFSHNPLLWMPEDQPVRVATRLIDERLKGTTTLEVVVDTKKQNGIKQRDFLLKLQSVADSLGRYRDNELFVGKTIAVNDLIKEINRALDNRYQIPANQPLVNRNFLLFENTGADDLSDLVDIQNSLCRFTIKLPWLDAIRYGTFIDMVTELFESTFAQETEITVTGVTSLLGRTLTAVMHSTARSFLIAFGVIAVLMILLLGDIKTGLISMIPNLFPIVMGMGLMMILDLPLDMFTMLVANIAIGLAVDDTIHFMHNFRRYFSHSGDARLAIEQTLLSAGRAMITTSVVLAAAFYTFILSEMENLWNFGFLTGTVIVLALAADFLLAPALMTLATKKSTVTQRSNS
jgi:predicted RND superfamily exporter protein